MTTPRLDEHIERETKRGAKVAMLKLDRFSRAANPFSIYVLMVIRVGIAARKPGMGFHLFLAVVTGFLFVFASKIITVYAAAVVPAGCIDFNRQLAAPGGVAA